MIFCPIKNGFVFVRERLPTYPELVTSQKIVDLDTFPRKPNDILVQYMNFDCIFGFAMVFDRLDLRAERESDKKSEYF